MSNVSHSYRYDPDTINPYALRSIGIDPGWGRLRLALRSLNTAITKYECSLLKNTQDRTTTKCLKKSTGSTAKSNPIRYASTEAPRTSSKSLKLKIGERGDYLKEKPEIRSPRIRLGEKHQNITALLSSPKQTDANPYQNIDR